MCWGHTSRLKAALVRLRCCLCSSSDCVRKPPHAVANSQACITTRLCVAAAGFNILAGLAGDSCHLQRQQMDIRRVKLDHTAEEPHSSDPVLILATGTPKTELKEVETIAKRATWFFTLRRSADWFATTIRGRRAHIQNLFPLRVGGLYCTDFRRGLFTTSDIFAALLCCRFCSAVRTIVSLYIWALGFQLTYVTKHTYNMDRRSTMVSDLEFGYGQMGMGFPPNLRSI